MLTALAAPDYEQSRRKTEPVKSATLERPVELKDVWQVQQPRLEVVLHGGMPYSPCHSCAATFRAFGAGLEPICRLPWSIRHFNSLAWLMQPAGTCCTCQNAETAHGWVELIGIAKLYIYIYM